MQQSLPLEVDDSLTALGIELGSTRIKAVLIDSAGEPVAAGGHAWESELIDDIWSYRLESVWQGIAESMAELADDYKARVGRPLTRIGSFGVSAMMHGYLVFDEDDQLLVPFRTWRNTRTQKASAELTELFGVNIPQRWSIAHLHQAILDGEEHISRVRFLTTLAGFVHWRVTGHKVLGAGDASGVFPLNAQGDGFDPERIAAYQAIADKAGVGWQLAEILPKVAVAGTAAGQITDEGARLLDPSGTLQPGSVACPPEGDAGTGMVATNSVRPRTGNVSAGTSAFAMVVLERPLARLHPEIDPVATPSGDHVAMVHTNNCTGDMDDWLGIFGELLAAVGAPQGPDELFEALFAKALEADPDCGGLLSFNYLSGEHSTGLAEGRPLFVRSPHSDFSLANFMRLQLSSAFATLRLGMEILLDDEHVELDSLFAQGGVFRTKGVAQRILAAALETPVSVGRNAGEGGAWGMAILAAYMASGATEPLADYLGTRIFADAVANTVSPDPVDVEGFAQFIKRYRAGLPIEREAVNSLLV